MTEEEAERIRNQNNQQTVDLAVIKVQVDAIFKKQDDIMTVVKDEFSRIKESYSRQIQGIEIDCARNRLERKETCAEHKKCIDDHCNRIRVLEKQQDVSNVKLGGIVLILTTIFTILSNFVWDIIVKK
jgi:hypothetical protein